MCMHSRSHCNDEGMYCRYILRVYNVENTRSLNKWCFAIPWSVTWWYNLNMALNWVAITFVPRCRGQRSGRLFTKNRKIGKLRWPYVCVEIFLTWYLQSHRKRKECTSICARILLVAHRTKYIFKYYRLLNSRPNAWVDSNLQILCYYITSIYII